MKSAAPMPRSILLAGLLALVAGLGTALLAGQAEAASTVRFWYHFDNPENPMNDLVAKFEAANPGIEIEAEPLGRLFPYWVRATARYCQV